MQTTINNVNKYIIPRVLNNGTWETVKERILWDHEWHLINYIYENMLIMPLFHCNTNGTAILMFEYTPPQLLYPPEPPIPAVCEWSPILT